MRRPASVRLLALCIPLLLLAAPAARAASVWTDGNGDGLPDAPGELVTAPYTIVSVDVWIDSGTFVWTNFLAYVEWTPSCLTYLNGAYLVSGGERFPVDDFSHPSGVGYGGYNLPPRQGVAALMQLNFRIESPVVCCVSPIIDTNNPYYVFCQLGQAENYMAFSEMSPSCWELTIELQACCFVDGSCADLSSPTCVAQGGTPRGAGTACATTTCEPVTEGCCYPDGSCVIAVLGECPSGTTPRGEGSDCDAPCAITVGACCYMDGSCADALSRIACEAASGDYGGDGTTCAGVTCVPRGACCFLDGGCTDELSAEQCALADGAYRGDGTLCAQVFCAPRGACCFANGSCADSVSVDDCTTAGGMYRGNGSMCSGVTCVPWGACCLPSGACQDRSAPVCAAEGGVYQGDGTQCADVSCPQPTGACCSSDGSCADGIVAGDCVAAGGAYRGDGTTCAGVTCDPWGACCLANGQCLAIDAPACDVAGGVYQGDGTRCFDVDCPDPTGACCIADSLCEEMTAVACDAAGGEFQGPFTTCENTDCFTPPSGCGGATAWISSNRFGGYAGEFSSSPADVIRDKNARLSGNVASPADPLAGGETIMTATPINVPGASSGYTCDNYDDYDETCPFSGSTSPDEVYVITGVTGQLTIDVCNSNYDTKLYVYCGGAGDLVACNDDACNSPAGDPFRSIVSCVNVSANNSYYIVVDGYFGDCGSYNISTYYSVGCPAACDAEMCPPGAVFEGEPVCGPNYIDSYNGGCNSVPPVFYEFDYCPRTVCGAGGNYIYGGLSYRDTDWYQINLPLACNVTATLCASFPSQLAILDGNQGCDGFTIVCGSVFGTPGATVSCGPVVRSGTTWFFVATSEFSGVPCGSRYNFTVDTGSCCVGTATESKSWGQIKALFR